jgi:hypothetical protein
MNLFKKEKKISGFIYSAFENGERFRNAKAGDLIVNENRNPPYIVVYHSIHTPIINKWPGKLFEVEIINQSEEKDLNKGLIPNVCYTRTLGVKILREVPVDGIFGPNGKSICKIIDLTRSVTEEQVNLLSKFDSSSGRDLYSKTWRNWIKMTDANHVYLNEDHSDTLKVFRNQEYGSPIGDGLSIISSQFSIRAKEINEASAFGINKDGEIFLKSIWFDACEKLLQAGMSYEQDNLLTEEEKKILRDPVMKVFNLDEGTMTTHH